MTGKNDTTTAAVGAALDFLKAMPGADDHQRTRGALWALLQVAGKVIGPTATMVHAADVLNIITTNAPGTVSVRFVHDVDGLEVVDEFTGNMGHRQYRDGELVEGNVQPVLQ